MGDNNLEFHNQANEELHQQWQEMLKDELRDRFSSWEEWRTFLEEDREAFNAWLDTINQLNSGLTNTNDSVNPKLEKKK